MPNGAEILVAAPVIAVLIVIEGLLSVDNALAIAAMASHLPGRQKVWALRTRHSRRLHCFEAFALWFAAWIIANRWLKLLGAVYLIFLMCRELTRHADSHATAATRTPPGLLRTIVQIEILDLSLSLDNVVAAVALSPKLWVVYTGVFIGILALRLIAGLCIRLILRFPILAQTAFLLVGFVGFSLLYELATGVEVGPFGKLIGVASIVALSLIYARVPAVRRALRPAVRVSRRAMRIVAQIGERVTWPVRRLRSRVRRGAI